MLVYLTIFVAAILEGEIYYISVLRWRVSGHAQLGRRAGAPARSAARPAINFWFYLLRGRIEWLDRFPKIARYRDSASARHVHAHETLMILASRFLPGLRTAIPVACAYANVPPLKFTPLNLISAFAWAGTLMALVKVGALEMSAFGLNAWWGPLIPAALLLAFVIWLGRPSAASAARRLIVGYACAPAVWSLR